MQLVIVRNFYSEFVGHQAIQRGQHERRRKLFVVTFTKLLASLSLGDADRGCFALGPFIKALFVSKGWSVLSRALIGTSTASPHQGLLCSPAWWRGLGSLLLAKILL